MGHPAKISGTVAQQGLDLPYEGGDEQFTLDAIGKGMQGAGVHYFQ